MKNSEQFQVRAHPDDDCGMEYDNGDYHGHNHYPNITLDLIHGHNYECHDIAMMMIIVT